MARKKEAKVEDEAKIKEDLAEEVGNLRELLQEREKQLVGMIRELADINDKIQDVLIF